MVRFCSTAKQKQRNVSLVKQLVKQKIKWTNFIKLFSIDNKFTRTQTSDLKPKYKFLHRNCIEISVFLSFSVYCVKSQDRATELSCDRLKSEYTVCGTSLRQQSCSEHRTDLAAGQPVPTLQNKSPTVNGRRL